jgi:carbonic anhydrase
MTTTDEVLRNAEQYASRFEKADLPKPPARKLAVVACMDARLIPTKVLGLEEGDAHVIRNAGGVVTDDTIRSLAISQHKLGTEEIILIHHTDCGMLGLRDEEFRAELHEETGVEPAWAAESFTDIERDLRQSIERIRNSPFIPHKNVRGFVYEVETGKLREVG